MYATMTNPAQYEGNTLMLPVPEAGQVGTNTKKVVQKFRAAWDISTMTAIDRIVIGGVTYNFTASRATTTEAGKAGILSEIDTIITGLIGVNNGKSVISVSGNQAYINTDYCELKLQQIGVSGDLKAFVPVKAKLLGIEDSTDAGFECHVKLNTAGTHYEVRLKPVAGKSISDFTVDYNGGTDEYTAAWPKPTAYSLPAGSTIENGYLKFDVLKATGDAAAVLAVSVTATGGIAVAYSQSVILADFKNQ